MTIACPALLRERRRSRTTFPAAVAGIFAVLVGGLSIAHAQETTTPAEEELPPPLPALIVSIGGIDRAIEDLSYMFEVSGRPDMMDVVKEFIDSFALDGVSTKGIDRTKPVGFMLFLEPGLPPQPQGVGFVPVSDIEELAKTAGLGPLKLEKVEGSEDRYELRGGRRGIHVKVVNGYAYISRSETLIEEPLPDPLTTFSSFVSRYDIAVSLQIRNVPRAIRDVFATMLAQQAETEMQQRDGEPDSAYEIRKANSLSMSQAFEQVLRQGEEITIGLDAAADGKRAVIDINTIATPDSEYAAYLKGIGGRPTMFAPLMDEDRPLSVSLSWSMDRREKEAATGFFKGIELALVEQLGAEATETVASVFSPIKATIERGHADGFLQFAPREQDQFVLIGGLRVVGGESFGAGLRDLLFALAEDPEVKLDDIEFDAHTHLGVTFHRLTGPENDEDAKRLFRGHPSAYLGADSRAIWLALGTDGALDVIDAAIEKVNAAPGGLQQNSLAPFQMIFRLAPWLELPVDEENISDDDAIGRELAGEATADGEDAIRLEVRPTDTGSRFRIQFDAGFVRLLGMLLAQQYDKSQL